MDLNLGDTQKILGVCDAYRLTIPQKAYILATAFHETAGTMKPVAEAYWVKDPEAYRKTLPYYPWYGRGYVQLTWDYNYDKADKKLSLSGELMNNPDLAMDPDIAKSTIVIGMMEGWFTGRKIPDYIAGSKKDYYNARKIVNGLDDASLIAGYADQYEDDLNPTPLIMIGSRGEAVTRAQVLLTGQGFSTKGIDGMFGKNTDLATRAFQESEGLLVDGKIGNDTWKHLLE